MKFVCLNVIINIRWNLCWTRVISQLCIIHFYITCFRYQSNILIWFVNLYWQAFDVHFSKLSRFLLAHTSLSLNCTNSATICQMTFSDAASLRYSMIPFLSLHKNCHFFNCVLSSMINLNNHFNYNYIK